MNFSNNEIFNEIRKYRNINVLSIDWDAYTGDYYVGACCGYCNPPYRKVSRGSIDNSIEKFHRDDYMHFSVNFPNIFPISLFVSECHADILKVTKITDNFVNIDFHEDIYDGFNDDYLVESNDEIQLPEGVEWDDCSDCDDNKISMFCGSWANHITNYNVIHNVGEAYDFIKNSRFSPDLVFLCLSSPWTPKQYDNYFFDFIGFLSSKCLNKTPYFIGHKARYLKRKYSSKRNK